MVISLAQLIILKSEYYFFGCEDTNFFVDSAYYTNRSVSVKQKPSLLNYQRT